MSRSSPPGAESRLPLDLHNHHRRCGHARGELVDYVAHAVAIGLPTLGVADHAPRFADAHDHPLPRIQMARSEYPRYLAEVGELRERYADRLELLVGIEADFLPGTEAIYREALTDTGLDYVIGSVHEFDGVHVYGPDTWSGRDLPGLYRAYFAHVRAAARSGLFDVLAHFDAVKVFGPDVYEVAADEIEPTLDAIADSGIVVEINTAGLRKCGEIFPRPDLIGRLHERGVSFTFGSDAHRPEELVYGAAEVGRVLDRHGIDTLVSFRGRERRVVRRAT
jgi:histidinol-phosphatase (PHP family)